MHSNIILRGINNPELLTGNNSPINRNNSPILQLIIFPNLRNTSSRCHRRRRSRSRRCSSRRSNSNNNRSCSARRSSRSRRGSRSSRSRTSGNRRPHAHSRLNGNSRCGRRRSGSPQRRGNGRSIRQSTLRRGGDTPAARRCQRGRCYKQREPYSALHFTTSSFIEPSAGHQGLTGGRIGPESLTSSSAHHPGQCPLPGPSPGV